MAALTLHHTLGLAGRAAGVSSRDQHPCVAAQASASRRSQSPQLAAVPRLQQPAQPRPRVACAASSSAASSSGGGGDTSDYAALQGRPVYSAASGAAVELPSLWRAEPGRRCIVVFLTHFADLSSTELAQKLKAVLPEVSEAGLG